MAYTWSGGLRLVAADKHLEARAFGAHYLLDMIDRSAFRFASYQAAAFYASLRFPVNRVLPRLLSELGNVFDGDPVTLPIPENAPPEIPRVVLSAKDQSFRMEISLVRTDVRWQRQAAGNEMPLGDFVSTAEQALTCFHRATRAWPGRLALVSTRFQVRDQAARDLAQQFCRPELLANEPKGPLNRPENFELHAHKTFPMGRFLVNSWVRCKTGQLSLGERKRPVIFVEHDLNTSADLLQEAEHTDNDIRDFHHLAMGEMETVLRLYFPDSPRTSSRVPPED